MIEHLWPLSISAFYVGDRGLGMRCCEKLLALDLDPEKTEMALRNRVFYLDKLENLVPLIKRNLDFPPAEAGWSITSPSMLKTPDGFAFVLKSSNRKYDEKHGVVSLTHDDLIVSQVVLVKLNGQFVPVSIQKFPSPAYEAGSSNYQGIDHPRPFLYGGEIWLNGVVRNLRERDGRDTFFLAKMTDSGYQNVHFIESPNDLCDWVPVVGKPYNWISNWWENGKTAVSGVAGGKHQEVASVDSTPQARHFRPATQVVPFGDGFLSLVKEVSDREGSRVNCHRFIKLDRDYKITKISRPFFLDELHDKWNLESANGLMIEGDDVYITYSTYEAKSHLAQMKMTDLDGLLVIDFK